MGQTTTDEEENTMLAEEFHVLGFTVIGRNSTGSLQTQYRRFRGHFGVDWYICADLWLLLVPLLADEHYFRGAKPKHLLWTLLFLKCYDTEVVLSARVHADEKTFRKWIWMFVDLLSYLSGDLVSDSDLCLYVHY